MAKTAHASPPVEIDIHIELWRVERLIPRANNPRTHSREQVAQIAASIREFRWTNVRPWLVRRYFGNNRLQRPEQ